MSEWKKMDSAPKDGTVILLLTISTLSNDIRINTGFWAEKPAYKQGVAGFKIFAWCSNGCYDDELTFEPDMWHPLPKLPVIYD